MNSQEIQKDMKSFLAKVATGATLTETEAEAAFGVIMSGEATQAQIGAFLMALRIRGETVDEITGAARIMRAKALKVKAPENAMDIVGTGGDGAKTLNISTGAALVVAGCGVPVAKHGNRAISSQSGAADVLAALGVNLDAGASLVVRAIRDARIGFLMAPRYHSAMRHVGGPRVEMGVRTVFNILGPLINPAGVKRLFTGAFSRDWIEPMARTLGNLGCEKAWVAHGSDGLDEMTTVGPSWVAELKEDGSVATFEVRPEDAGIPRAEPEALKGGDPSHNAEAIQRLLKGEPGPYRDIVLYNAAGALIVAGQAANLVDGVALAAESIDKGAALAALENLIAITSEPVDDDLECEVGG